MKGKKTHPSGRAWWREYRMTCLVLAAAVAVFIAARLIAVPAASGNSEPEEYAEYENGVITQILADNTVTDPASDGAARGEQLLLVDVKTGQYAGETLQVYNYVGPLYGGTLKEGQGVTLIISTYSGGTHTATVFEYNRTLPLIVIVGLFLLVTVLVGGKVGAKSLVGLAVTLACLFWILIPLLMKGAPTLLTTLLVCAYITVVTLTILGGFRRKTVCAMVGTLAGVALAMAFGLAAQALLQVDGLRLSDVEPLLQLRQTGTPIGLRGLLVAGVVISALGAVMDVAMSISSALSEVHAVAPERGWKDLVRSGMNIGRDMVGTMTNTLILAFAGSSLNTLLLFQIFDYPMIQIFNADSIAIEIIRGVAGTIGIILTVPLVALLSAEIMGPKKKA